MNNLQPLKWTQKNLNPLAELELTAYSALHEYVITEPKQGRFELKKTRLSRPDKKSEFLPYFEKAKEAQDWAWAHYQRSMQPYVKPDPITDYFDKFKQWGLDRGIIQNGDALAQGLKLVSEMGELADNLAKDRCIKDDIGDCMVVLTMLANMTDTPIEDCLAQAWGDIKDRKGFMNENGVFIKEDDEAK